ncbi:MAG TPA: hypothetical protein VMU54_08865 [Planctomycetota bacterium]|nr:hypothetical protein [Planctomycetota bacterium]
MRYHAAFLGFLALTAPVAAQDSKGFDSVDQKRVAEAIAAGVDYLKKTPSPGTHHDMANTDELVLLTLVEARVPDNDPVVEKLLAGILGASLDRTYKVVLQAMVLEELDRVKYQERIWQCAQFLVDNQGPTGQWGYGEPTAAVKNVPTGAKAAVASGGGGAPPVTPEVLAALKAGERIKPPVVRRLSVTKTKEGPAGGDNSNSQYAALGLRACHDAGIKIPESVVLLAKKFWYDTQHPATEAGGKKQDLGIATGPGSSEPPAAPRGWCYGDSYGVCKGGPAYAAMTAGATGTIVIYEYIQGRDWRKNEHVRSGLGWLAKNWSVTENLGPSEVEEGAANSYYYYYLYALERLGMLYDSGKIGGHLWYPEGAKVLLEAQQKDGSWKASRPEQPVWDTCFAILFLKRATRPLVASDGGPPRR